MSQGTKNVPIVVEHDYIFRSECVGDIEEFISVFKNDIISHGDEFGEEFEFSSLKNLEEIRLVLKRIDHSIFMYKSLNYSHQYTGELYYDSDCDYQSFYLKNDDTME